MENLFNNNLRHFVHEIKYNFCLFYGNFNSVFFQKFDCPFR